MPKPRSCSSNEDGIQIQIHGWDGTGWFSHEFTGMTPAAHATGSILRRLKKAPGTFYGKIRRWEPGSLPSEFLTTVHDLTDSGLAIVHVAGYPGGPAGALAVVPAHRRSRLRSEFAFGFVAHLSFLDGLIGPDAELAIHDYVDNALRTEPGSTHVFIVETPHAYPDAGMALSAYLETLSMAMLHWLRAKDGEGVRETMPAVPLHAGSRAA